MASDKEQLLSMGFSEAKVSKSLRVTKNAGLQPALEWLMEHAEDPEPQPGDEHEEEEEESEEAAQIKKLDSQAGQEARSLQCDDCGKKFRTQASAEFHAGKSGHENFSESTEEIKPLTEEEKKQKLAEMRSAMAAKKASQAKEDAEDARRNEQIRRKAGKESAVTQQELKVKQAQKEAEERKKEKVREVEARNRVKMQIEQDKKERAERSAREKAIREGRPTEPTTTAAPARPAATSTSSSSSSATNARLQLRLPSGPPLQTTVEASTPLSQVAQWLAEQRPDLAGQDLKWATSFPRKTFTKEEMGKSCKENGLTPSAALIVSL